MKPPRPHFAAYCRLLITGLAIQPVFIGWAGASCLGGDLHQPLEFRRRHGR